MKPQAHPGRNRIAILGSTGSIGTSALDIVRHNLDELEVVGLAGRRSVDRLEEQAREFRPRAVAVHEQAAARALQERLGDLDIEVWSGPEGQERMGRLPEADLVLTAVEGVAGLLPTLSAVEAGKVVALANKEPLVAAGELVVARAAESGARLLPVDSEHNAIYQALQGHPGLVPLRRLAIPDRPGSRHRRRDRAHRSCRSSACFRLRRVSPFR